MAAFPALFDTNVLFGFHLNDVILGMAERGLFRPLWSEQILAELSANLIETACPKRTPRGGSTRCVERSRTQQSEDSKTSSET